MDEAEDDPLAMSRLDIVSCGLGAASLLAVVLSIPRDLPAPDPSVTRFVRFHVYCTDQDAELRMYLSPDTTPEFDVSLARSESGQFESVLPTTSAAEVRVRDVDIIPPKSQEISTSLIDNKDFGVPKAVFPVATVVVQRPVGEDWGLRVLYSGRSATGWEDPRSTGGSAKAIQVVVLTDTPSSTKSSFELLPSVTEDGSPGKPPVKFGRFAMHPQGINVGTRVR